MSTNLQQIVQSQVQALSEEELEKVLEFMQNLRRSGGAAKPISELFSELSSELPMEEWEELPTDGAENHDHYLYGAPKKS